MSTLPIWLFEAAWRGGLLLAVAGSIAWALRRRSAEVRHAIWLAGLIGVLLLPLALLILPRWPLPVLPTRDGGFAQPSGIARVSTTGEQPARPPARPRRAAPLDVPLSLWLTGMAFVALRAVRSHRQLAALASEAHPVDDPAMARELRRAAAVIGIPAPRCLWTDRIDVPLAAGWHRPLLLLPGAIHGWDADQRRSALLHELSHLRRGDPLWLALAQVAKAFYWFHPLVWLGVRQLRAESERACDDAVLRAGERASGYADTLLAVAQRSTSPAPAAGVAFVRVSGLESRIAAILATRLDRTRLGRRQWWSVAVAAMLVSLSLTIAQPVPAEAPSTPPVPAAPSAPPMAAAPGAPPASHPTPSPAGRRESAWLNRALRTTPSWAKHVNEPDAPVLILEARARWVPEVERGRMGITMPELRLANRDPSRRVRAIRLALELPSTRDRIRESVSIPAGEETFFRLPARLWSSVVPDHEARRLEIQIVGVDFADGSTWVAEGLIQPPPPPRRKSRAMRDTPQPSAPIPPEIDRRLHARAAANGPTLAARFRNPPDAEVVIVEARTPLTPRIEEDQPHTWLPRVRVENRTNQRVVGLRVRYKPNGESHAVSGFEVSIEPHGSATLIKDAFPVWGRAEDMKVQILGARFADGSIWGTMDSSIDARDVWVYPLEGAGAR